STTADGRAAARLTASAAGVVVGGRLFSGMSISVGTPPAAAALVAVAKPSHPGRPRSLTCTGGAPPPGRRNSRPGRAPTLDPSPGAGRARAAARVGGPRGAGARGDPPVAPRDGGRAPPLGGDRPPRPDHQLVVGHAPFPAGLWSL